jgi:hypothetical protein
MSAIAFLQGLSQQDVSSLRYQVDDPLYPVIILARAAKANDGGSAKSGSLESVRRLQARLQSFLSMRRIEARRKNASALRLRFSQSLASLRQRLSQAMVRSTILRLGKTANPTTRSERLTISTSRCGRTFASSLRKLRSLIAAVGKERLQKGKHPEEGRHDENATIAILDIGRMNDGVQLPNPHHAT